MNFEDVDAILKFGVQGFMNMRRLNADAMLSQLVLGGRLPNGYLVDGGFQAVLNSSQPMDRMRRMIRRILVIIGFLIRELHAKVTEEMIYETATRCLLTRAGPIYLSLLEALLENGGTFNFDDMELNAFQQQAMMIASVAYKFPDHYECKVPESKEDNSIPFHMPDVCRDMIHAFANTKPLIFKGQRGEIIKNAIKSRNKRRMSSQAAGISKRPYNIKF